MNGDGSTQQRSETGDGSTQQRSETGDGRPAVPLSVVETRRGDTPEPPRPQPPASAGTGARDWPPARYAVSPFLAVVIAFCLFWLMQFLVSVEGELDDSRSGQIVDFVRLRRSTETEVKKREPPDRKPPEREPPPPPLNLASNLRPDLEASGFDPTFQHDGGLEPGEGGFAASDSDAVPLVRVNPEYPLRAARRGIEGWVEVEFIIGKTGSVKDARVVGYEPSSIFNRSALRAIEKWKYNPKIENGEPIERHGVVVRLAFRLED